MMGRMKQSTVSLPLSLIKQIDFLIEKLGYWPSRSAFVREACLAKIKEYKQELNREGLAREEKLESGEA
jgi:Arc/MetJ-type ribon-helix-helix transcriptional regulator